MKRIIWVSVLLALAGIIMPVLFLKENVSGEGNMDKYMITDESQSVSPEPSDNVRQQEYVKVPDKDIKFTVAEGERAKEVTMVEYLPYAIAAEMPADFAEEALKAQAVAARTYILYCTKHENPKHPQADICKQAGCCLAYADETELRGIWGAKFDENMAAIRKAVTDTDGQVLIYDETPILASFHSSSAGKTESGSELWGDIPYLKSVKSPETEKDVPNYITTVEVSKDNFRETILSYKNNAAFSEKPEEWVGETELDDSGRVRSITIAKVRLSGPEIRKLFSLRSTAFKLEYKNGIFLFTVTGYGHGLGMSQYGANVMAKNGFDYKEILAHYYPNTELCT